MSIHPSVHLPVCPRECASLTPSIPCVQSAHLTQSSSGSARCQMPNNNWKDRLFLRTVHSIVSVSGCSPHQRCDIFLDDHMQHVALDEVTANEIMSWFLLLLLLLGMYPQSTAVKIKSMCMCVRLTQQLINNSGSHAVYINSKYKKS